MEKGKIFYFQFQISIKIQMKFIIFLFNELNREKIIVDFNLFCEQHGKVFRFLFKFLLCYVT